MKLVLLQINESEWVTFCLKLRDTDESASRAGNPEWGWNPTITEI